MEDSRHSMLMRPRCLVAAALLAASCSVSAAPTLIGDTVTAGFTGQLNDSASAVVVSGGAPEFTGANLSPLSLAGEFIDVGASSITLNLLNGYFAPQTITLSDLDFQGEAALLAGFILASNSIIWLTDSMISFSSSSITIDVGTGQGVGGTAVIDLLTRSELPEPGSLTLAGVALLAAFSARRRKPLA